MLHAPSRHRPWTDVLGGWMSGKSVRGGGEQSRVGEDPLDDVLRSYSYFIAGNKINDQLHVEWCII